MNETVYNANSNDLCALKDVKDFVFRGGGNQTSTDDNFLQRLITMASGYICGETSRNYAANNYTEIRSGTGGRIMFVKNPPIISVTSVHVNGNAIDAKSTDVTQYLTSNGYAFAEKYVSLYGNNFERGLDNVQIVYRGGYNSVPVDLQSACIELVGWAYREIDRLGQISKVLAGEQVNFNLNAMSKRAQQTVNRYRRLTQ